MHECSVVEQLLKLLTTRATEMNASSVRTVNLVVGELTGYMEESLRFYFKILARDTLLAEADLRVTYVKPKLHCPRCDTLFERRRYSFDCPACGSPGNMTKIGSEFYIDTIEVELNDAAPAPST